MKTFYDYFKDISILDFEMFLKFIEDQDKLVLILEME